MRVGKLRVIEDGRLAFWCQGCKEYHMVNVKGEERPQWTFNQNFTKPTFNPSVLVRSGHYVPGAIPDACWCTYNKEHPEEEPHFKCGICHTFITDGVIHYLTDCTHELAGKSVEMVIPEQEV